MWLTKWSSTVKPHCFQLMETVVWGLVVSNSWKQWGFHVSHISDKCGAARNRRAGARPRSVCNAQCVVVTEDVYTRHKVVMAFIIPHSQVCDCPRSLLLCGLHVPAYPAVICLGAFAIFSLDACDSREKKRRSARRTHLFRVMVRRFCRKLQLLPSPPCQEMLWSATST